MISRIMSSEHSLPNSLSQHELESAADDNIKTESTAEARARESVPGTSGQLCLRLRAVRKRARPCDAVKEGEGAQDLLKNIPQIRQEFHIISKIGEGTFSSVYLAQLKANSKMNFAVKYLVPTSSITRIENEVFCLQKMGGCDHVIPLLMCIEHENHVALVMPFFKHDKFIDYLPHMSVMEVKKYMRALFTAMRKVHSHGIIHRDIKPSNFLYNRASKEFQLVDFGLAHLEKQQKEDRGSILKAKSQDLEHQEGSGRVGGAEVCHQGGGGRVGGTAVKICPHRHKVTAVCRHCIGRGHQVAPRAGTPGFRAPEVLLKYPLQTTSVDVWAAGMILLCLLSGRYPFFKAHDDMSAMAQIVGLFGSAKCTEAAKSLGKDLICSPIVPPLDLKDLCTKLRTNMSTTKSSESDLSWNQVPESVFDLMYRCLDLNPSTRITAKEALRHTFLSDHH